MIEEVSEVDTENRIVLKPPRVLLWTGLFGWAGLGDTLIILLALLITRPDTRYSALFLATALRWLSL